MKTHNRIVGAGLALILAGCLGGCQPVQPAPGAAAPAATAEEAAAPAAVAEEAAAPAAMAEEAAAPAATAEEAAAPAAAGEVCGVPELTVLTVAGLDEERYPFSDYAHAFGSKIPAVSSDSAQSLDEVDKFAVAFVAAHGTAGDVKLGGASAAFSPLGDPLGHCGDGLAGSLRYYIFDACNVMAHGKRCGFDYSCPGTWRGNIGSDDPTMRNVYARWGSLVGNSLRMVCGPSTLVDPANVYKVIDRYLDSQEAISVADSVLGGLAQNAVAVCLTRGGPDMASTPLVTDMEFVPEPNNGDETHYQLQYSKVLLKYKAESQTMPAKLLERLMLMRAGNSFDSSPDFPNCMPAFRTAPLTVETVPLRSQDLDFRPDESEDLALSRQLSPSDYIAIAQNEAQERGLSFNFDAEPAASVVAMLLASTPVDGSGAQLIAAKNVQVVLTPRFDPNQYVSDLNENDRAQLDESLAQLADFLRASEIEVDEGPFVLPFLDEYQRVEVWLNNDGTPLTVISRRQPILDSLGLEEVIPPDLALAEARAGLGELAEEVTLDSWAFGYDSFSGESEDRELHLAYQFHFVPDDRGITGETTAEVSPRTVWIEARTGNSCP